MVKIIAHKVICPYCNKTFDRDKTQCVQIGRRYAHTDCALTKHKNDNAEAEDKQKLLDYLDELFNHNCNWVVINQMLKKYISEYNYTYSGIMKAMHYFYEIKGNSIAKANGSIGIIPYIYNESYQYYYDIWLSQQRNKDKDLQSYVAEESLIVIPPPERKIKKKKHFSFLDKEV